MFCCIGEVIIEIVFMLTGALMIVRFHLILWKLDDVILHFCEPVYGLKCGRKGAVSVGLFVCCVL